MSSTGSNVGGMFSQQVLQRVLIVDDLIVWIPNPLKTKESGGFLKLHKGREI